MTLVALPALAPTGPGRATYSPAMEVISLGWRTDLALLELAGSTVEHRSTHVVVRTPGSPAYAGGNFVLLRRTPLHRDTADWLRRFAATFPEASSYVFGVDDPEVSGDDLHTFDRHGFDVTVATVLTARSVTAPGRSYPGALLRPLTSADDWAQRVDLAAACEAAGTSSAFRAFAARRAAVERGLAEAGRGRWFGAFAGGRMLAGLGLVDVGAGLARFQEVETHPEARGRGLATSLVHHASAAGLARPNVHTLVMVSDSPAARRLHERVGFVATERQAQASRRV